MLRINVVTTLRSVLLLLAGVVLTSSTLILGIAPLMVIRRQMGALPFLLLGLGLTAIFLGLKFFGLSILMLVVVVLAASLVQLESSHRSPFLSAFWSVILALSFLGGAFAIWARSVGGQWKSQILSGIDKNLLHLADAKWVDVSQIQAIDIMNQLPSVVVGILVVGVALGLVLERPLMTWAGLEKPNRVSLTQVRMPEAMVWAVIASLLFAFVEMGMPTLKIVALNILNLAVVCYFFQGIAILCRYFDVFKVGIAWRVLWVLLFSTHLFLLTSVVGFVDYWFDLRSHFHRKASELKKKRSVR